MKRYPLLFTLLLLSALLLAGCSTGLPALSLPASTSAVAQIAAPTSVAASTVPAAPADGLLAALQGTLEQIYTQVNPSVVNIQVVETSSASSSLFPQIPGFPNIPSLPQVPQTQQALGSGFVWDTQGHIVTNDHVVDGASKISVTFYDGTTVPAEVTGTDPDSDLAVIKVAVSAEQLHPVQLADSTQVKVGELAIAIGNPFGLQGTMTMGIISALGRTLPSQSGTGQGQYYSIPDVIQTDAPINPGNSGGVLVDDTGSVIGVTAAIESSVQSNAGIGFVIPSQIVEKVVPALIETGHYDQPWIGISGTSLVPDLATGMGLAADQRGALVVDVVPSSPAAKAGLQGSDHQIQIDGQTARVGGDVIVAVDGQPVKDFEDLIAYLANSTTVGQTITLSVLRDGKNETIDLTLAARPSSQTATGQTESSSTGGAYLGIVGLTLTPEIAQAMNLPSDQQGVMVSQVQSNSPADQAGLKGSYNAVTIGGQQLSVGGDVITAVDGLPIASMGELQTVLQAATPGQTVLLTILRDGNELTVEVVLGERPVSAPQ
jgi:serine protease Do